MHSQEVILEMSTDYPFGVLEVPQVSPTRASVRKVVAYTQQNYVELKAKFNFVRKITNSMVIRLLKVLEEQGLFHLFYQYIPYNIDTQLASLTPELLDRLKTELIILSAYFSENKLATEFYAGCIGVDAAGQFRYYLGTNFSIKATRDASLQNNYICQINRICRGITSNADKCRSGISQPAESQIHTGSVPNSQLRAASHIIQSPGTTKADLPTELELPNRQNSVTSQRTVKTPKSMKKESNSPIQLLEKIELRIGQLKTNLKGLAAETDLEKGGKDRYLVGDIGVKRNHNLGPRHALSKQHSSKKTEPKSPGSQKSQVYAYSPVSPYSPYSLRNMGKIEQIRETGEEDKYLKQADQINRFHLHSKLNNWLFCNPDGQSQKSRKQPKTKADFEEVKRKQFENLASNREKYVKQFFDVLGGKTRLSNTSKSNDQITSPTTQSKLSSLTRSYNQKVTLSKKSQTQHLQQRVKKAIQQADLALNKYRRLPRVGRQFPTKDLNKVNR